MHRGGRVAVHEDKGRYHRRPLFRGPARADEALVLDVVDLEVLPDERPSQELEPSGPEVPLIVGRPRRPDDRADDLLVGGLCLVDDAGGPLWLLGHLCFVAVFFWFASQQALCRLVRGACCRQLLLRGAKHSRSRLIGRVGARACNTLLVLPLACLLLVSTYASYALQGLRPLVLAP